MPLVAAAAPQKVEDFGLIDHNGDYHQLSKYRHKKAVVIIAQQNACEENYSKLAKYKLMQSNFNSDRLTEPKVLPACSRVLISGAFDNSENQVGNFDPSAIAYGGQQTWEEMFIGYLTYHETGREEGEKLSTK
ncbi:hypothetical protein NBRC116492_11820 [Aurantivibrio infirmus]